MKGKSVKKHSPLYKNSNYVCSFQRLFDDHPLLSTSPQTSIPSAASSKLTLKHLEQIWDELAIGGYEDKKD